MASPGEPVLSLPEWVVLCLICEKPTHGFAIAELLSRQGSMGRVWHCHKEAIYRAMRRLELLGLVQTRGQQPSSKGPVRSLSEATPAGRKAARAWLGRPVLHVRDVRSELMVKLALLDRAGADPQELIRKQRAQFLHIASALDDQLRAATGFDRIMALWRHEAMSATIQFLDAMCPQAPAQEPGLTPAMPPFS
jgi:DNA-binding PadR family transcriptional regulator